MKSRARDKVGIGALQIADWKTQILRDFDSVCSHAPVARHGNGSQGRGYNFQPHEAITPNPFSSGVVLRHLISRRRLTFLTYLFRAAQTPFESTNFNENQRSS